MQRNYVAVRKRVMSGTLRYKNTDLLSYKIEYPVFISAKYRECTRRLNKIYLNKALDLKRYCETELFKSAVEEYNDSIKNNYPVRMYGAGQTFEVTLTRSCIVSLYFDRYEYTGGAHGTTVRSSQTWQLQNCKPVLLEDLLSCQPDNKTFILSAVNTQIQTEPDIYFEDYTKLSDETFNHESFYCTPDGVVVYYQQYDIAPYSSGIREFMLPYGGCVKNPTELCE
jgi:Protein of unknown function (DUF3298).